jgi:hypothetical protein
LKTGDDEGGRDKESGMASWMVHLRLADILLDRIGGLDEEQFGSINHPRKSAFIRVLLQKYCNKYIKGSVIYNRKQAQKSSLTFIHSIFSIYIPGCINARNFASTAQYKNRSAHSTRPMPALRW